MTTKLFFHQMVIIFYVITTILFISVLPAYGQLTVLSTIPADGTTNVNVSATFEFTFSVQLDTSARFAWPENFYLGILFQPDTMIGDPDSVTISPDLKTVRVYNLHLHPDTRYFYGLLDARSLAGQYLEKPQVSTFTTGKVMPLSMVSGTIAYPGGDPTGTLVALTPNLLGGSPAAMAVVTDPSGNYTINYVPAGTYYPYAMKDMNHSGNFEPEPGLDPMAVYLPNGMAGTIDVREGFLTSGINMTLSTMDEVLARQRYADAVTLAQKWAGDSHPVMVAAPEVNSVGESFFWIYYFFSPTLHDYYGIFASNVFYAPFPLQGGEPPDTSAIPLNWINSDVVADTAEFYGGGEFRNKHPNASVNANLMNFRSDEGSMVIPKGGFFSGLKFEKKKTDLSASFLKKTLMQNSQPFWLFQYSAEGSEDFMMVVMDPVTGKLISVFPPELVATKARDNLNAANQAALTWASDAALVWVGSHQSDLGPDGKADMWFYAYYSAGLNFGQSFFFSNGTLLGQMGGDPPYKLALPPQWIDSDVAMAVAESHGGGQYRGIHQNVMAGGGVMAGILPDQPDRAVWQLRYTSSTADPLTVYVDAITGEFIQPQMPASSTARVNLDAANQAALGWTPDAVLIMVGTHQSNLSPDGKAQIWFFLFHSVNLNTEEAIFLSNGTVLGKGPTGWPPPSIISLPDNWINSDVAMIVAESHGGYQYRSVNDEVMVSGGLVRGILPDQPDRAVWQLQYTSSTADPLTIYVDAITGEFIQPQGPAPSTARVNLDAAKQAALGWAQDAALIMVGTHQSNLSPDGKAQMWFFLFHSAALNTEQAVFISNGVVLGKGPTGWPPPSTIPLPDNWIDSDVAMAAAEDHGGADYRQANQNVQVIGSVSRGYCPGRPEQATWTLTYGSSNAEPLTIYLDALTGVPFFPTATVEIAITNLQHTISNNGRFGDGYFFTASAEWPANSGVHYLWVGGLWVGAKLSSGEVKTTVGGGGTSDPSEWIPTNLLSISTTPDARSDQDSRTSYYSDELGIEVTEETYAWQLGNFILYRFQILNLGIKGMLDSLYLGLSWDFDVANAGPGDYSLDDLVELYDGTLGYMRDDDGDNGLSAGWVGMQFLSPPLSSHMWWTRAGGDPDTDESQFARMSTGQLKPDTTSTMDYRLMQTVGPFSLAPGDTLDQAIYAILVIGEGLNGLVQSRDDALYKYRLLTHVPVSVPSLPSDFILLQNHPNPFNPETVIEYRLPKACHVEIDIFNIQGQKVARLVMAYQEAGYHRVTWDGTGESGRPVVSGIYLYQLNAGSFTAVRKMLVIR